MSLLLLFQLNIREDKTIALTGVSGTTAVGSVSDQDVEVLGAVAATGSPGSVSLAFAIALAGQTATASAGSIMGTAIVIPLSGVTATASAGSAVAVVTVEANATGLVGSGLLSATSVIIRV